MTRNIIIALGLLGLAVIGRAAAAYVSTDPVALAMCVLMAAVLVSGIVELVGSTGRLDALREELGRVEKEATREAVDGASPHLRGLLRSRLERVSMPVPAPTFAPYLVGLLVMLGLLGTFLGLFETLRGARAALSNSGDLEALRAGLVRPMAGLVRSFGTSAAGVASSAVLGLASVVARRAAQALSSELALAVAGPLAPLATSARELAAIEALALQGRALPAAADALDRSAKEIAALGPKLGDQQREILDAVRTRMTESLASIEKQLARSTESIEKQLTASALSTKTALESAATSIPAAAIKAVEPHLAKSLEASTSAATKHLDDVRKAVEKDVDARRAAEAKLVDATTKHLAAVEKSLESSRASLAAAEAARAERVGQVLEEKLAALAESLGAAIHASTKPAVDSLNEVAATFGPSLLASTKPATDSLASVAASFGPALSAATVPVTERLAALAANLDGASKSVRDQADTSVTAIRADQERIASLFDRLGEASTKVGEAAIAQSAAVDRVVMAAESRVGDAEKTSEARISALLERMDAMVIADRERSTALDALLRDSTTRTADEVSRLLSTHASGLSEELAKTQALVHEAAGLVHSGGADLESLATSFADAVDRHRSAADEWLANLGKVEAAVISAGETAASDVLGQQLARTHEIFDRQLRFQNELLDRVRGRRDDGPPAEVAENTAVPAANGADPHEELAPAPAPVQEPQANPEVDSAPELGVDGDGDRDAEIESEPPADVTSSDAGE